MTKAYEFNWQRTVPQPLLDGNNFHMWEEEKGEIVYEPNATFKVDEYGFFIYWKSEGKEKGEIVYEPNATFKVDEYGFFIYWKSEGKEGQVLELCQVNDIRLGGVPKDPRLLYELQQRTTGVLEDCSLTICSGYDMVNINYTHIVCPDDQTAKNDVIEPSEWTFERFYRLYHKVCPRNDIEELFNQITQGKSDYIDHKQLIDFLNDRPELDDLRITSELSDVFL
ncbi:unnamed protein product [Oppiella nova]|uniref:PLC-beta PH domain-containing protein n=1 Tax=Oppiella nova TaxID=334625 RepID=A0A7R9MC84_9ACAR|nr:unnamed protein product [Oppiella nova]CAG2174538.1 unnamed protein product [Oppiella nova]